MSGRVASHQVLSKYPGLQAQTSSLGLQIGTGWGTFRIRGNLVDAPPSDFKAIAQKSSTGSGGKGGGGSSQVTGYTYTGTLIVGICQGQIDSIRTVYVDSKIQTLSGAGLSLNTGAIGQAVWSYMTTNHPERALGYSGLAIAYASAYPLGTGGAPPNHSFEVVRTSGFGVGSSQDADPSLVISDLLGNGRYGVPGWAAGQIDTVSLTSAANSYQKYCLAAGLLLSPLIDAQRSAADFLNEILLATNSTVVWSEGLLKFIPYGDTALTGNGKTYTPNLTPVYALDDDDFIVDSPATPPVTVAIADQSDAFNVVQLEFLDRANQYNMGIAPAEDQANGDQFGVRRQDPTSVHCICDSNVAAISAHLYLQRTLFVRDQYVFKLGWMFAILEPGDLLLITDSGLGLSSYPVRIIQIDEDEQYGLTITAEDAPTGVSHTPLYVMQNGQSSPLDHGIDPGGVEANLLIWSDQIGTGASWGKVLCDVTGNATTDQYGLTTASSFLARQDATNPTYGKANSSATSTTLAISNTAGVAIGVGNTVVVTAAASAGTITGVTDSAGNSYSAGNSLTVGSETLRQFYSGNASSPVTTHNLSTGSTITVTYGTSTAKKYAVAMTCSDLLSLESNPAGTTGTSTSPSISSGALAQKGETVFTGLLVVGGAADTFTESGAGAGTGYGISANTTIASNDALRTAEGASYSLSSLAYAPTLGTSRQWGAGMLVFKVKSQAHYAYQSQSLSAYANTNYTFSCCLKKGASNLAQIQLNDSNTTVVYATFDVNAGTVFASGVQGAAGVVVSANIYPTLVAGIWRCVVTGYFTETPGGFITGVVVVPEPTTGALLWPGDWQAGAFTASQAQLWRGVDDGRTYAATTSSADEPLLFTKPAALYQGQFFGSAAVGGGPDWGGANVWLTLDNSGDYQMVGTIDAPARYGALTANLASHADPDSADTLSVDISASEGALSSASTTAADQGGTLIQVDNELLTFSTATLVKPARYNLTGYLRRGFLNTEIAAHASGAPFVRLDEAIFDFPYLAPNEGSLVAAKFQSFNQWGGGLEDLSTCIAYAFTPGNLGGSAPGSGAWTAIGTTISNAGQSIPAIQITGASDNPSATAVIFYYRLTGQTVWNGAGQHPINTAIYYITSVAAGSSYDVGVAYWVNGVITPIQIIASAIAVGNISTGGSPGSTLLNSTTTGTTSFTFPAGSYTHADVWIGGIGGHGYYAYGGKSSTTLGGSGASSCIKTGIAVTPGVSTATIVLPASVGSPATYVSGSPSVSLSAPSGINATSGGVGAAPAAATGGTTNYTGHAGGRTNVWDGGGCFDINGNVVDQTAQQNAGTSPGGGGSGTGAGAAAQIIIIARA